RGHDQDVADVTSMFRDGLLTHEKLLSLFNEIKPHLYKYPAIDPKTFSDAVDQVVRSEIDH
ncbi:MAG TPA: hypothetical protein PK108_09120, partial [Pyrinomonadaceae bacterium]|nr:hypothetical protein [Pyrinomonadaceae bacterium]